jgi:hypothetical protein
MWVEGQCHILATLPPGKTHYPLYGKRMGPRAGLDEWWKSLDRSDRTKLLYSLCYPSPLSHYIMFKIITWCSFDHAIVLVAANAAPRCGWRPTGGHGITVLSNISSTQTSNPSSKTRKMKQGQSWQIIYCLGAESTEQVFKLVREVQRLASLMAANCTHTHTVHNSSLAPLTKDVRQPHTTINKPRRCTSLTRKGTNPLNS